LRNGQIFALVIEMEGKEEDGPPRVFHWSKQGELGVVRTGQRRRSRIPKQNRARGDGSQKRTKFRTRGPK
jgi:hypothetical protein